MIPIIDSHHHIWRVADLAWLAGPMVPRIFGPYEAIRRDYDIAEFRADLAGSGVAASVYVQTNWPAGRSVDEVAWVQSVADVHGWPQAIVGHLDLLSDDAPQVLAEQMKYSRMRGVRMQLHWHENEMYRFAQAPDLASDPRLRRNIRALAQYGLPFELQVFSGQMPGACELAKANPDITFILQHAGMLEDTSPAGVAAWRDGMRRLADLPNVVAKLTGLGTFIHRNDPAHIARIVADTIALFGAERCLFGSNFPVEKLWTSYADLVAAHRAALAGYPVGTQRLVLGGNAARIYRIEAVGGA